MQEVKSDRSNNRLASTIEGNYGHQCHIRCNTQTSTASPQVLSRAVSVRQQGIYTKNTEILFVVFPFHTGPKSTGRYKLSTSDLGIPLKKMTYGIPKEIQNPNGENEKENSFSPDGIEKNTDSS